MTVKMLDTRKVTVELEGLPNVPESQIERRQDDEQDKGLFKPEKLHASWTRTDEEDWSLKYLTIDGMRYSEKTGKLDTLRGGRVYTWNYQDLLSLIDAPWLPPLIKLIHPAASY